jgi:heme-degrading monooxygenase HmoA
MPRLLARVKVPDFAKWKPSFDQLSDARKKYGMKGLLLLQDADNPNEATVLTEWDNLEDARKYVKSSTELKDHLQKTGIKVDFYFLNEVERH